LNPKVSAYLVHLFTALGVVFGFLALLATVNLEIPEAFLWLALALFVDGVDGTLARAANVKENTPYIDGAILDNIIDYLNYVVVPVFIFYTLNMVPEPFLLLSSAAILLVSCFTFINTETKTEDFYFSGFPANWNIVILYFYILDSTQWINLFFVLLFCVLTFIPFKYVHPFRVVEFRKITLLITSIWMVTTTVLLFGITFTNPLIGTLNYAIWLLTNAYFLGNVFYRSMK
jgi:phosphatidylcholine synthase|tara:strand:- start:977 stop:1669 length:693 start_codon:yes stop_codon:yes gene_type:complete